MIVALMYDRTIVDRAMSLARLLADVETSPRSGVCLALVRHRDVPVTPLTEMTAAHCRLKFEHVSLVESPLFAEGHPRGCTALWVGTVKHFHSLRSEGKIPWSSVMTLDAGDGVPLHADWLDVVASEHSKTVLSDKLITGTPYWLGTCPLHVNPNAVFDLSLFDEEPGFFDPPEHDGTLATHFDVYYRDQMLKHLRPSSVVRTDWHGDGRKADLDLLLERSQHSAWLHGYKDDDLYWLARTNIARRPRPPQIHHYDLPTLLTHEKIRRDLEACSG